MDKETETTINRLLADNEAAHDLNGYLTKENRRLREIQGRLIGTFRVNMMRLSPEYTHEGFDEVIAALNEG